MTKFAVITFGCQMNQHDSERIGEVLEAAGYVASSDMGEIDVIVVNTCSVREKAEQKLRSEVGRLGLLKRSNPRLVVAVAGCVAQQEGQRMVTAMPQVDVVVGPDNIGDLPEMLRAAQGGSPPQVRTVFDLDEPHFLPARPKPGRAPVSAFVTTMKGCDEHCTFCIVPTTRGPERYRPAPEIVSEIQKLVNAGCREVTLLGQTVDSYRDPLGSLEPPPDAGADEAHWPQRSRQPRDESEFAALLYEIARQVPRLVRLRYTSPHPRHLTPALVGAHERLGVLARHVHMPVQSGSDRVLKRMSRRYTILEYEQRTKMLRERVPGLTLSTDVIVGFPGETRQDFEQTLALVQRMGFVGVFGFKYSPRPNTPALKLGDDVEEATKAARLDQLFALSESLRQRHLAALVGSRQKVLVEGAGRQGGFSGRTERNEIVHFGASEDPTGELVEVEIVQAFKHSLGARLTDGRAAPFSGKTQQAARLLPVL